MTNFLLFFIALRKQKLHLRTFVQKQFNINKTVEKINKLNEEEDEEMDDSADEPKQVEPTKAPDEEQTKAVDNGATENKTPS